MDCEFFESLGETAYGHSSSDNTVPLSTEAKLKMKRTQLLKHRREHFVRSAILCSVN